MKKIIDGRRYDTATAECLGIYSYGYSGDFEHVEKALYRTAKGAYFVAGAGGPRSEYSQDLGGNNTGGGSGLHILTEDEAKAWLEQHGSAEEYEAAFGVSVQEG